MIKSSLINWFGPRLQKPFSRWVEKEKEWASEPIDNFELHIRKKKRWKHLPAEFNSFVFPPPFASQPSFVVREPFLFDKKTLRNRDKRAVVSLDIKKMLRHVNDEINAREEAKIYIAMIWISLQRTTETCCSVRLLMQRATTIDQLWGEAASEVIKAASGKWKCWPSALAIGVKILIQSNILRPLCCQREP